jgi:hypothetical protein
MSSVTQERIPRAIEVPWQQQWFLRVELWPAREGVARRIGARVSRSCRDRRFGALIEIVPHLTSSLAMRPHQN